QEHHPVPPDIHRGLRCAGHSFFIFFFSSRSCSSAAASRAARSISPLSSSSLRSMPGRAPPACCRSRHARSADRSASVDGRSRSAHLARQVAQIPRRRRGVECGAQRIQQTFEQGALAFPNRLREERRVHLLHCARLAFRAGGPLASVLLDLLLLTEAPLALRAAVLVDRHGAINVFHAESEVKLTAGRDFSDWRSMMTGRRGALALALAAALGCNKGLEPAPAPTACPQGFVGVCGTVTFQGTKP